MEGMRPTYTTPSSLLPCDYPSSVVLSPSPARACCANPSSLRRGELDALALPLKSPDAPVRTSVFSKNRMRGKSASSPLLREVRASRPYQPTSTQLRLCR